MLATDIVRGIYANMVRQWQTALVTGRPMVAGVFDKCVREAKRRGCIYRSATELSEGPVQEIIKRLDLLERKRILGNGVAVAGVLGAEEAPGLLVSDLVDEYFRITKPRHVGKCSLSA